MRWSSHFAPSPPRCSGAHAHPQPLRPSARQAPQQAPCPTLSALYCCLPHRATACAVRLRSRAQTRARTCLKRGLGCTRRPRRAHATPSRRARRRAASSIGRETSGRSLRSLRATLQQVMLRLYYILLYCYTSIKWSLSSEPPSHAAGDAAIILHNTILP